MRRRSFLFAAGAAAVSSLWKLSAQTSLGTLAWAQSDGLWIRHLPDGSPAKIASGTGLHSPHISPSGRWISYNDSEGKLSIVRSDGTANASLEYERGVWLPREDQLAAATDRDVAVFSPANSWKSPVALWKDSGLPLASPDGKQFVSVRTHERPSSPNGLYKATAELYTATFAAPDKTEALLSNEGDIEPYAWTRDGKSILYWRAHEWSGSLWADGVDLYSIPAAGGPERGLGIAALHHDDVLDLAPDSAGNWLAATNSGGGRETWAGQQIIIVDPDAGAARNLTALDIAALCPAWSPDGQSILCYAAPDADVAYKKAMNGVNIKIMNTDGTVRTEIVTPDTPISAIGGGEEAHAYLHQRKLWLLDPAGGRAPLQLTSDPKYRDEEPLWSADGSHILFARMDYAGHPSLWLMESTGANPVQVCTLKVHDDLPRGGSWFGYYGYVDWRSAFDWRR
jgi:hypothetical protein